MQEIISKIKDEVIKRSNEFESITKGTKDEYNLYKEHIQYVYKYALMLIKDKDIDKDVVELSALLHDIAMTNPKLERSRHNEYGAMIAKELLTKCNYPSYKIELIVKCILNHSNKRKEFRTTKEESILVDADALAHFDSIKSLYSLAYNVMGLTEIDSINFIKDKLTKDYKEVSIEAKKLINDKYNSIMNCKNIKELENFF